MRQLIVQALSQDYLVYLGPGMFLLSALEGYALRNDSKYRYNFSETVTNLSIGVLNQVAFMIYNGALAALYLWVYRHYAWLNVNQMGTLAVLGLGMGALVFWDFCHYYSHWIAHNTSWGWGFHSPHHQSSQFNWTVAFRNGMFQQWINAFFFLPMAFVGVPAWMFICVGSLNLAYQFYIHQARGSDHGKWSVIWNSPQHHKMHHAIVPGKMGVNYGGTFLFWDRLFGTYMNPSEEYSFGTFEPVNTFEPLKCNWIDFLPARYRPQSVRREGVKSVELRRYLGVTLAMVTWMAIGGKLLLQGVDTLTFAERITFSAYVVWVLYRIGRALDHHSSLDTDYLGLVLSPVVAGVFFRITHCGPVVYVGFLVLWLAQAFSLVQLSKKEGSVWLQKTIS